MWEKDFQIDSAIHDESLKIPLASLKIIIQFTTISKVKAQEKLQHGKPRSTTITLKTTCRSLCRRPHSIDSICRIEKYKATPLT